MLVLVVCVLGAACSQDKGNYDYVELIEPKVSGIQDMNVLTFAQLRIDPVVEGGEFPESEYSFQWKVLDNVELTDLVVIGEERILDYEVTLAPGSYTLFLTITELATGLYWQFESQLTVSSSMSEGWMVLCSDQGRARLDFVSVVTGMCSGTTACSI